MKFNCGLTAKDRADYLRKWHRKFVWWPTKLSSGDCRWLEVIEMRYRQAVYDSDLDIAFTLYPEYRALTKAEQQ